MKKSIFYLTVILFLGCFEIKAQTTDHRREKRFLNIYLEKFDLWISPEKCPDTIVRKINDTTNVKVYLKSVKGELVFFTYNLENKVLLRGEYADALDVFKRYVVKFNAMGKGKIYVESYYQPVKNGNWIHYHNGSVIKSENFIKGDLP